MQRATAWIALLVVAGLSICRIVEHDTPWYLAAGDLIWKTRSLPDLDPFSYTSTRPWLNHEWLSELVFSLCHGAGGFVALGLLQALVVALSLLALGWRRRLAALTGLAPLAWALAAFVLREAASPRAQLFSTLLFAATLALVLADDATPARRSRLWLCLPLQLVWTQLHGGNPTGVALLGLLWISGPSRRRALVALACALLTIAGPYGARVHGHFLGAHAALPTIREWEPLSVALRGGSLPHWVALGLIVAAGLVLASRWRRGEPVPLALLMWLVFSAISTRYLRFSTEASLVSLTILGPALGELTWARLKLLHTTPIAVALFAALCSLGVHQLGFGLAPGRFPIAAVRWLREHRPVGPMFNSYNFGGYLLWAWPEQKVFVDGRAFTVYDESIISALPAVYTEPERFTALEQRFGFRLAVLQRGGRGAAFLAWLRARPGWTVAYEDEISVVLARTAP